MALWTLCALWDLEGDNHAQNEALALGRGYVWRRDRFRWVVGPGRPSTRWMDLLASEIWIAQGANPYPCRYVITSKDIPHSPQYSIQIRDWKTGSAVASDDFGFKNSTNAKKVDVKDLKGKSALPDHFKRGAAQ